MRKRPPVPRYRAAKLRPSAGRLYEIVRGHAAEMARRARQERERRANLLLSRWGD